MAKAVELLKQALVSECEQPFEIPMNWVWTTLGNLSEYIQRGKSPKYSEDHQFPVISQKCIQWGGFDDSVVKFIIPESINTYGNERFVQVGDILWNSTGTGTIGRINLYNNELDRYERVVVDSHVTVVRIKNVNVNNKFVYYYLCSPIVQDGLESRASGTTNQIELNISTVVNMFIPLPPLTEQQRIVNRIENLFAKLDKAKELAQNALDSFETRKAAILQKAFKGELTSKWREENDVGMDSWSMNVFENCTVFMQNGISKRKGSQGKETVVLRLADIFENTISTKNLRTMLLDENEITKYTLLQNDILIVRVNGSVNNVGKLILVESDNGWTFCDHLIKVRFDSSKVFPEFMKYYSMTEQYRHYVKSKMVSSAGQNTISQKSLGAMYICIPTLSEQQEIVRHLQELFRGEEKAKELLNVIHNIDIMKKAILARAFRGQLGTNDSNEESALEMLKEIVGAVGDKG